MKHPTITALLIACGLLTGCDEDDSSDDSAENAAEESSSSDESASDEGGSDDSNVPPWQAEIDRCGVLVDCFAADCDAEREAYITCRAENVGNFAACSYALDDFGDCAAKCVEPTDCTWPPDNGGGGSQIPGSPSADPEDCTGPYNTAWYTASHCLLEQNADCDLDGPTLCEDYY